MESFRAVRRLLKPDGIQVTAFALREPRFVLDVHLGRLAKMMRMLGFDCGSCRRPFRSLSADEVAALRADLDRVGFWALADKENLG